MQVKFYLKTSKIFFIFSIVAPTLSPPMCDTSLTHSCVESEQWKIQQRERERERYEKIDDFMVSILKAHPQTWGT